LYYIEESEAVMVTKTKVLVIDDDVNICELIRLYVEKDGYEVLTVYNGKKGIEVFTDFTPNIVILDIMLPGADGWQVCREIRKISNIPIIMLTAKGETFDKVLGLELGADDYIVKPFDPKELVARIKAVLRRYEHKEFDVQEIVYPNLVVNRTNYAVKMNGKDIDLPPKELELLFFLASNPNKVFTREQLLEHVWGFDFYGDSRTVDVHVKRLREKIDLPNQIWQLKTVWGVGYKFEVK
jgi:two-component system, OmpR family, response regulator